MERDAPPPPRSSKNLVGFLVGDVQYAVPLRGCARSPTRCTSSSCRTRRTPSAASPTTAVRSFRWSICASDSECGATPRTRRTKWIVVDVERAVRRPGGRWRDRGVRHRRRRASSGAGARGGDDVRGIAGVTNHAGGLVFVLEPARLRELTEPLLAVGAIGPAAKIGFVSPKGGAVNDAGIAVAWLLGQEEPEARRVAVQQLVKVRSGDVAELFVRALGDSDWRVRKEAASIATSLERRDEVVRALVRALDNKENIGLRNAAVEALITIGTDACLRLSMRSTPSTPTDESLPSRFSEASPTSGRCARSRGRSTTPTQTCVARRRKRFARRRSRGRLAPNGRSCPHAPRSER